MSHRAAAAPLLALTAMACVVPPSQAGIGPVATAAGVGTRGTIGASSAALDPRGAEPIDLGAGYVGEAVDGRGRSHGTYLALAGRVARWTHTSIWLGARAEVYWATSDGQPAQGGLARLGLRRHLGGVQAGTGDGSGALGMLGAAALGAYLDLGGRRLDGGGGEVFGAAGVAVELPGFAGVSK